MIYDVIIIGAGISGLTCAALLSKRDMKVCVIDAQYKPGGSCGIFKREDTIYEQGASMIYGFGEKGFAPHRFVFNALKEPIDIIKHNELYAINYNQHKITFHQDIDLFIEEVSEIFPKQKSNFKKFYKDMSELYLKVIAENPVFISPDIVKKETGMKQLLKHPLAYIKFLGYMNTTTEKLLRKYFDDDNVLDFFNKLTSTYCYTNVYETPAILSSIMFVDNHFGGSYYPAGSTLHLIGKLEKVIEEGDGDLVYNKEVEKIIVKDNKVKGVRLDDKTVINGKKVVNSGTVWNLYNKLLKDDSTKEKIDWANSLVPTYPSLVLFTLVKEEAIPDDTLSIEMLIENESKIDESEITVYIPSIDDKTLCKKGYHTVIAIGPSFKEWPKGYKNHYDSEEYKEQKRIEKERMVNVIQRRFPKFKENIIQIELSTPSTLQRYILKEKGAVAGPKQQLGQHMLNRLQTKGEIEGLYNCGESTVMGTGTPAVTVSGISAANLILREFKKEEFEYKDNMKEYVNIVSRPFEFADMKISINEREDELAKLAIKCQFCEVPICEIYCEKNVPIRDINRRVAVGNFCGASKLLHSFNNNPCQTCGSNQCEKMCIRNSFDKGVDIININKNL